MCGVAYSYSYVLLVGSNTTFNVFYPQFKAVTSFCRFDPVHAVCPDGLMYVHRDQVE